MLNYHSRELPSLPPWMLVVLVMVVEARGPPGRGTYVIPTGRSMLGGRHLMCRRRIGTAPSSETGPLKDGKKD